MAVLTRAATKKAAVDSATAPRSPFLALPAELRLQIYSQCHDGPLVFVQEKYVQKIPRRRPRVHSYSPPHDQLGLLLKPAHINQKTRQEALEHLFQTKTFAVRFKELGSFYDILPPAAKHALRSITLFRGTVGDDLKINSLHEVYTHEVYMHSLMDSFPFLKNVVVQLHTHMWELSSFLLDEDYEVKEKFDMDQLYGYSTFHWLRLNRGLQKFKLVLDYEWDDEWDDEWEGYENLSDKIVAALEEVKKTIEEEATTPKEDFTSEQSRVS